MNLLDHYLAKLRMFLPRLQRNDIVREIAGEIREQLEAREEEFGRPPTTEEQAEVIGRYGHPLLIAARYRPQRYLIGPVVFPYYWLVLKIIVGMTLLGHAIAAVITI